MAEILTPWEYGLLHMQISDWEELNPCECEAECACDKEDPCSPS